MIDLDDLERLADAAEWDPWDPWDVAAWHSGEGDQAGRWGYGGYITTEQRDLVAAASPSTVKALIERVRRLEEATDTAHRALGSFLWLGNNLHNSGTETFRDLYRAALEDAGSAYKAGIAAAPIESPR